MTFPEAKAAGKLPLGQLPVLDVDGTLIVQSGAINRFVPLFYLYVVHQVPGDLSHPANQACT